MLKVKVIAVGCLSGDVGFTRSSQWLQGTVMVRVKGEGVGVGAPGSSEDSVFYTT